MDRLKVVLILPAVAVVGAAVWFSGMAWPIATTFARCFAARAETEDDVIA